MCCRYWIDDSPVLREITDEMKHSPLMSRWQRRSEIKTGGEIRPQDIVPVIAPDRFGERAVFPMKWGYSGKSLLINARAETAAVKATFQNDWRKHRCIVPASWYFEWEHVVGNDGRTHTGKKYKILPKDSSITWLCGLYRIEEGMPHFVILTRDPAAEIRFIHDRMPMILPENRIIAWIRPDSQPEQLIGEALTAMTYAQVPR